MKIDNSQGIKRYFFEFGLAMVAYVVVLVAVVSSRPNGFSEADGRLIELLPVIPLVLAFWAIIRQYKRSDEYYQRLHSEAFALGAMILGLGLMIWGFAENAGAPSAPTMFLAPALIGLWGVCIPIVKRRY